MASVAVAVQGSPIVGSRRFIADALERILLTFLVGFGAAALTGRTPLFSVSTAEAASFAGIAAVLTTAKTLLAGLVGQPGTASLLPSSLAPLVKLDPSLTLQQILNGITQLQSLLAPHDLSVANSVGVEALPRVSVPVQPSAPAPVASAQPAAATAEVAAAISNPPAPPVPPNPVGATQAAF